MLNKNKKLKSKAEILNYSKIYHVFLDKNFIFIFTSQNKIYYGYFFDIEKIPLPNSLLNN